MEAKHSLLKSFEFAFDGIKTAVKRGRNFRIQITAGLLACIFGLVFGLSAAEWLDLVIVITLVLILELVNSSIEAMVDLVSPEIREKAKTAKDVAAATVLVASAGSVIIGAFLFLPKIFALLWHG